jgi:retron-type reverse transcriptase
LKDTKKCVESRQLHKEEYLQERRVELRSNAGVQNISFISEKRGNNGNEYSRGLLEKIIDRDNMNMAYKRVVAKKGSHGVDGMTVDELLQFLKQNGNQIKQSIMEGTYCPKPVRRVEIPKPDGGIRLLGIPTVLDRVIQQAIAQVLSPIYEKEFSGNSYGFRPKKNSHHKEMQGIHRSRILMDC